MKSQLGFLRARAWLDEDGRHVWLRHKCDFGWDEQMLPWPEFQAVNGKVQPSVDCMSCDSHAFVDIGEKPVDAIRVHPEKKP